jgi:hypothetical protein
MDKITHNLVCIVDYDIRNSTGAFVINKKGLREGEVNFTKNDRCFQINKNGLFEIVGGVYLYIYLGESDD